MNPLFADDAIPRPFEDLVKEKLEEAKKEYKVNGCFEIKHDYRDSAEMAAAVIARRQAIQSESAKSHKDFIPYHYIVDFNTGHTEVEVPPDAHSVEKGKFKTHTHNATRVNKVQARLKAKLEAKGLTPTEGTFRGLK
jgi:hypothetical protein